MTEEYKDIWVGEANAYKAIECDPDHDFQKVSPDDPMQLREYCTKCRCVRLPFSVDPLSRDGVLGWSWITDVDE